MLKYCLNIAENRKSALLLQSIMYFTNLSYSFHRQATYVLSYGIDGFGGGSFFGFPEGFGL